jgi:MFS family permease
VADARTGERDPFARDGLTWTLYLQLSMFGYVLYGLGPSVSLLGHDLGLSDVAASLHGGALAVGAVAAGMTSSRLALRFGRSSVQTAALALLAVGVIGYCAGASVLVTLPCALVIGYAGNIVVNTTAAALSDHHGVAASARISEANGISAGVGMLAPFALGLTALVGLGWRTGLLVAVPLTVAVLLVSRRFPLPAATAAPAVGPEPPGRLPAAYRVAWTLFVLCALVEMCMNFWASEELRLHSGMSQSAATMTVTFMLAGMVVGRLVGARLVRVVPANRLLIGSLVLNLCGFALFWLGTFPWLAICGIVLGGLGMAMQFPLTVARAIESSCGQPDRAMAMVGVGEGIATALGPFLLGLLTEQVGIHAGFLLVPALLVAATATAVGLRRIRT